MTPAEASFIDRAWKAAGYQSWQAFMLDKATAASRRIINKEQTPMTEEWNDADYDLKACFEYNELPFAVTDIEKVLAVWEGEKDEDDWRWIVRLTDGRFALVVGWCDYTGWDCQSGAEAFFHDSPSEPIEALENRTVAASLSQQLTEGKGMTWNEKVGQWMEDF